MENHVSLWTFQVLGGQNMAREGKFLTISNLRLELRAHEYNSYLSSSPLYLILEERRPEEIAESFDGERSRGR